MTRRGYGIVGGLDPAIVRRIVPELEARGYSTFWSNSAASANGLETLAEAAAVSSRIQLGVGVLPLDGITPERILARCGELGLPMERVILGVGSGGAKGAEALALVRSGCERLVGATPATVVVGALGPKMTALAGEAADGALLSWLTPAHAPTAAAQLREAARTAGRPAPLACSYFRVALGLAALPRLRKEAERYDAIPAYAAHFRKMGVSAIDTCIYGDDPETVKQGLARFDGVLDEVVVRAIVAEERAETYLDLLAAAAPA